jgi:hypothetical protein
MEKVSVPRKSCDAALSPGETAGAPLYFRSYINHKIKTPEEPYCTGKNARTDLTSISPQE